MSTYTKYTGKVVEDFSGWKDTIKVTKDDGTLTDSGSYESFFEIGPDRYVVMPYWHDLDYPVIMTAKEVLDLVRIA